MRREGFLCVYRFHCVYRILGDEVGPTVHESQNLLAGGMLISTMMGLRMTDDSDREPSARELLTAVFAERPDLMCSRTEPEPEPEPGRVLKRETEA